ncbi:MAG: 30S ribosomal protein S13, partial [candidate division WOR-3 bacterium]
MARIVGVDLPDGKKVLYALPAIYGIGLSSARKLLAATGIAPDKRVGELS